MEQARPKFEVTPIDHFKVVDTNTLNAMNKGDDWLSDFLNSNRKIHEAGIEICVDGFYYRMVTFIEDGMEFTMLTPYRAGQLKYPKRNFAFGGYDSKANTLSMFFGGLPTTNQRATAIKVYYSLLQYCKTYYPNLKPFSIKY